MAVSLRSHMALVPAQSNRPLLVLGMAVRQMTASAEARKPTATHDVHAAFSCAHWDEDMATSDYSSRCFTCETRRTREREKQWKREDRLHALKYWSIAGAAIGLLGWLGTLL